MTKNTIHLQNKEIEKIIRDEISMRFAVFSKNKEKQKKKVEEMYKVLEYINKLEQKIERLKKSLENCKNDLEDCEEEYAILSNELYD